MVAGLVAALEGLPLLPYLFYGFGGAILVAFAWTGIYLRTVTAEIQVSGTSVWLRSVHECTRWTRSEDWQPLYDLRKTTSTIILGVGGRVVELADADWPQTEELLDALRRPLLHQRHLTHQHDLDRP